MNAKGRNEDLSAVLFLELAGLLSVKGVELYRMDTPFTIALITACVLQQSGWSEPSKAEAMWNWMAERDDCGRFIGWLYFSFWYSSYCDDPHLRRFCNSQVTRYWWPVHRENGRCYFPWVDGLYRWNLVDDCTQELARKLVHANVDYGNSREYDWLNYRVATQQITPFLCEGMELHTQDTS